ncbi:MAG: DUF6265 family protein [Pseudomarimonas sp.]
MKTFALFSVLAVASSALPTSSAANEPATLPHWLAGSWCGENAKRRVEEYWMRGAGGLMLGVGRALAPGRKAQFEFMRIEMVDGESNFIAQPQGAAGTIFKQSAAGDDWVRFENPAHDFPQRVEYRRQGEDLTATIAGPGSDGKPMTIVYEFKRCAG